jgi:uncharacterized protein YjbI with pentapeptide repeats
MKFAISFTLLVLSLIGAEVSAWKPSMRKLGAAVVYLGFSTSMMVPETMAVSGGGKDYANKDLRDGDLKLEGATYVGKDFTQVLANEVSFKGAKMPGCRFYKSNLNNADFTNADLNTASLEDAGLEGTIFDNTNLSGAYISSSFEMVGSIKGADFTDALMPKKTQANLCSRADIDGTNSVTGANTRDSLMCE